MASELSRLIDDELEKFERRPSADSPASGKSSFRIKAGPQQASTKPPWFWEREWWTWKKIAYACLAAFVLIGILYASRGATATKSSTGVTSSTDSLQGNDLKQGANTSQTAEAPAMEHSRSPSLEADANASPTAGAEAPLNAAEAPSSGNSSEPASSLTSGASEPAPSPDAFVKASNEAETPLESTAKSPLAFGMESSPGLAPAFSPESMLAQGNVSMVRLQLKGQGRKLRQ